MAGTVYIYFLSEHVAFIQIFMKWGGRKGGDRTIDLIVGLMEYKMASHDHCHFYSLINIWGWWYSVHLMGLVNTYLGRSCPLSFETGRGQISLRTANSDCFFIWKWIEYNTC